MSPADVHFWGGVMLAVILGMMVVWTVFVATWVWMEYCDWRGERQRRRKK